jgi:hypothetical protein
MTTAGLWGRGRIPPDGQWSRSEAPASIEVSGVRILHAATTLDSLQLKLCKKGASLRRSLLYWGFSTRRCGDVSTNRCGNFSTNRCGDFSTNRSGDFLTKRSAGRQPFNIFPNNLPNIHTGMREEFDPILSRPWRICKNPRRVARLRRSSSCRRVWHRR